MPRPAVALLTSLLAVALLGCGPAASPTPTPTPTAPASGGLPLPTAGAVAELEALIPDRIAGLTIVKTSLTGTDMIASADADATSRKFVEDLGVGPAQIAIAIGFGFSADASAGVYFFVFRAQGAGHGRLISVFKAATDATRGTGYAWTTESMGGKQVDVAHDPDTDLPIYLYATDELLFEFAVNDPAAAAEVLASLP